MTGSASGSSPFPGLPARRYVDPEALRLECEAVLWKEWQLAGHVSDLPAAGTALRYDLAGRSAFLIKGADGTLRAFLNACRHRGARLVEGDRGTQLAFCVDSRLRCPYHGWTYDDAGRLVHLPDAEDHPGLDRSAFGLAELPLATWNGFVFVAFGTAAPRGSPWLGGGAIPADAGASAMRRIEEPVIERVAANWKVVCEQMLDRAHIDVAQPVLRSMCAETPRSSVHEDVPALEAPLDGRSAATWSVRAYGSALARGATAGTAGVPCWRRLLLGSNTFLDLWPGLVRVIQVLPEHVTSTLVREVTYARPETSSAARSERYLNARLWRRVRRTSLGLCERVQRGLASQAAGPGPIGSGELALRHFVQRVRNAEVDAPEPASTQGDTRPTGRSPRSRRRSRA
jgi:phenylpropionate dioxygenase-like ring-hydroxylating dioxygenase large terminal subunit